MKNLIQQISAEIPKAFESNEYSVQKGKILNELKKKRENISNEINNTAVENESNLREQLLSVKSDNTYLQFNK